MESSLLDFTTNGMTISPLLTFVFEQQYSSAPACGVYVSQLIPYARACSKYLDFIELGKLLTTRILTQVYLRTKLVSTLKKFYGTHPDLVYTYMHNVAVSRIISDVFATDKP